MKKKVVGVLMTLLLCFISADYLANHATSATKTSAKFTDLKDLDEITKAKFDAMISAGVFDGVSEGTFGLNEEMNRAQFAKVAALIFNLEVDTDLETSSFSDVKADDPAYGYAVPYIEAVKAAGITDGYREGIYDPSGKVTKEQLATFLIRGLGKEKEATATLGVDDPTVSNWAKEYVAYAIEKNLMPTEDDGTFGGKDAATRNHRPHQQNPQSHSLRFCLES
ncbi:S-layer homology domain-containing protein [Paenibacillus sp. MBLB2552]|uniref:S-layer homology domain-containing protein n=1 Tax=Paenibacillus mellifer TaxID=2937794 RepID=A0A9X1Y0L5_9BACL|nr:S-layer homology domain-containing protein [Paenibacillus mellifer]MCK8489180.1 S-layer homology domain-containing protein [Paenibacillus mellifer]